MILEEADFRIFKQVDNMLYEIERANAMTSKERLKLLKDIQLILAPYRKKKTNDPGKAGSVARQFERSFRQVGSARAEGNTGPAIDLDADGEPTAA